MTKSFHNLIRRGKVFALPIVILLTPICRADSLSSSFAVSDLPTLTTTLRWKVFHIIEKQGNIHVVLMIAVDGRDSVLKWIMHLCRRI